MYYTGAGSAATRRISFPVSIADGEQHRILLSARGLTVALKIDDAKPILRTLRGLCRTAECRRVIACYTLGSAARLRAVSTASGASSAGC